MKPSNIEVLGFKFHGGDAENCLFVLYPSCVQDTLNMITDAKNYISETGSKWAEMTMRSKDGQQEIVKLYREQDMVAQSAQHAPKMVPSVSKTSVNEDPYMWSNYH